jgi:D-alanyl-D-alanine carboxypeptidase (penicillin-binding protein 5/6)
LFRQALQHPLFAEIVRTRSASLRIEAPEQEGRFRMVTVKNSNRLLHSYYGADGGKTGYTRAAKLCFVGVAQRGRKRLIAAVLGSPSSAARWNDVQTLFDYGFGIDHYRLQAQTGEEKTVSQRIPNG